MRTRVSCQSTYFVVKLRGVLSYADTPALVLALVLVVLMFDVWCLMALGMAEAVHTPWFIGERCACGSRRAGERSSVGVPPALVPALALARPAQPSPCDHKAAPTYGYCVRGTRHRNRLGYSTQRLFSRCVEQFSLLYVTHATRDRLPSVIEASAPCVE